MVPYPTSGASRREYGNPGTRASRSSSRCLRTSVTHRQMHQGFVDVNQMRVPFDDWWAAALVARGSI